MAVASWSAATAAGRLTRQQAVAQLGAGLAELGSVLPEAELLQALPLLRKLRIWFDEHR